MNLQKTLATFPRDMFAGTVVFLVALPLCLGIANASGVDPIAGLMSGIIGGLVVAMLSGSRLSVSGPAAGLVVIVIDGIGKLGSFSAFLLALMLSGVMQFGFGMLRTGRFASYVPSSVIKGMLAGIGLLLVYKQLPLAAGLVGDGVAPSPVTAGTLATSFGALSLSACAIAVVSLAILALWENQAWRRSAPGRVMKTVPAPLVVVVIGIVATLMLDAWAPGWTPPSEHRVELPSLASLPALQAAFSLPDFGQIVEADVWTFALTLAIVASLETLLCLEAVEQLDPKKRPAEPDRELKAQGVGNLLAGFIGALPITSVIVRSSANVDAGAQSRMSAVIHGALLLISVFALTSVINLIPLACLAAILIFTGIKLARPALFKAMAQQGGQRFLPFAATVAGVLATDLLTGIMLGIVCSLALAIFANKQRSITVAQQDNHFLLTFRKDVTFLGKVALKRHLSRIPDHAAVVIDATRADFIDPDARELIEQFAARAPQRNISVECRQMAPMPVPANAVARRMPFLNPV